MPLIKRQFNGALGQWPGPANQGQVLFTQWDRLPRNTRVRLHRVAWFCNAPAGGGPALLAGGIVSFQFQEIADASSKVILLDAEADSATTTPNRTDNTAAVDLCPTIVPRLPDGTHYRLDCFSTGLSEAGNITTLLVDWDLEPWPDSSGRDGLVP